MKGKKVTGSSHHGFTKGKTCLNNLIALYDEITSLVDEGKAVDVVYLDYNKGFNTVSQNILIEKLKYWLDKWIARWVKNWLNCHAQRFMISGMKFTWRLVTSGVPQGLVLRPILFSIFVNDLDNETECTLSKFADNTKLGGVTDTPDGHAAIQKELDRVGNWANRSLMKFNKEKCQVLYLGQNNPRPQGEMGLTSWKAALQKKAWWSWWTQS